MRNRSFESTSPSIDVVAALDVAAEVTGVVIEGEVEGEAILERHELVGKAGRLW